MAVCVLCLKHAFYASIDYPNPTRFSNTRVDSSFQPELSKHDWGLKPLVSLPKARARNGATTVEGHVSIPRHPGSLSIQPKALCFSSPRKSIRSVPRGSDLGKHFKKRCTFHPSVFSSGSRVQRRTHLRAALDVFVLEYEDVLIPNGSEHLYEDVGNTLNITAMPFYIISKSSSPSDVSTVLQKEAKIRIASDSPRILTVGDDESKLNLLPQKTISSKPLVQDKANTVHYIGSEFDLLHRISSDPEFGSWQLYHASWGDPSSKQANTQRIRSITLKDFLELIRWGLLMGVNDGCQEYEDGTLAS